MRAEQRKTVVIVGDIEPALCGALSERDLVPRTQQTPEMHPEVRAVVFAVPEMSESQNRQQLTKTLRSVVPAIAQEGACVCFICEAKDEAAVAISVDNVFPLKSRPNIRIFPKGIPPSVCAQYCATHDCGPSVDGPEPTINASPGVEIPPDMCRLLKRAFFDFTTLAVEHLTGGSAGRTILKVRAKRSDRSSQPFAIKISNKAEINEEIENYNDYFLEMVPFASRAPLISWRCATGIYNRALVTMFAERAVRFDDYVNSVSPSLAIAGLFDGPLRLWRGARTRRKIQLGEEFQRYGVLREPSARLKKVYATANTSFPHEMLVEPDQFMKIALAFPRVSVDLCHSHGDLHVRNVFAQESGPDVILIDYRKAGYDSPSARDPATLDVSIAFDVGGEPLGDDTLKELYRPNILSNRLDVIEDKRIEAIRQLRLQAAHDCNELEYDLCCSFLLFRAARVHMNPLAYFLASRLLLNAQRVASSRLPLPQKIVSWLGLPAQLQSS